MTESPNKPQIVIVDDEQSILDLFRRMLGAQAGVWDLHFFSDSRTALKFVRRHPVDAIISDVKMPHLNGLEFLERLRSHPATCDVPITMLTGLRNAGLTCQALDRGATDLLHKPLQARDLIARLRSMLRVKLVEDDLKRRNHDLEDAAQIHASQLRWSRLQIIWRLGKAAECRDEATGEHVVRVGYCSRILAETMGLQEPFLEELFLAAPLHDIGKIGIPDAILLKPRRLTSQERRVMQTHCELGERILHEPSLTEICCETEIGDSTARTPADDAPMQLARQIALSHHERWDGRGYPHRLHETGIPLAARIVCIADVYDALTSIRPYKAALPEDEAVRIIENGCGSQFDPQVVEALLESHSRIAKVRQTVAGASCRITNSAAGKQKVLSRNGGSVRSEPQCDQRDIRDVEMPPVLWHSAG